MIDIVVALDKLSTFETADDIALFLGDQGAKGNLNNSISCVMSNWLHEVTGDTTIYTSKVAIGQYEVTAYDDNFTSIREHTIAMADFVSRFDNEHYPELVDMASYECNLPCCKEIE